MKKHFWKVLGIKEGVFSLKEEPNKVHEQILSLDALLLDTFS